VSSAAEILLSGLEQSTEIEAVVNVNMPVNKNALIPRGRLDFPYHQFPGYAPAAIEDLR
jgi:hypothetical protein